MLCLKNFNKSIIEDLKFKIIKTGKKSSYNIVGEYESDIENKKLSVNSPLARGLIGKVKNEVVEINSPKGLKTYTVISVKYI